MKKDCVFCRIVGKELPSHLVYEDDKVSAFLDINPVSLGHTLIVPKEHYADLLQTPDEVAGHMMMVAKKISHSLEETVGADGFNLGLNNGETAGQVVDHLHLHVMPRFKNDGLKLWPGKQVDPENLEKIAKRMRSFIRKD
ncbi:MAG: HIT-like protein [candidate division WS2 bacterium ADurb.Bin280]|uniref:HIT-like protein n=1 Tax=candidate division WS2 bacterium ADurb.Bin280 TaxID=1852829 RepID=A0A1V5SCK3_9BACT|nr:MAG: HIT-like protein [candidate division WS2 bacterium ADurb.Bin280]